MADVYHLLTIEPHQARAERFTRDEWPFYARGYQAGVTIALAVMETTVERRELAAHVRDEQDRRAVGRYFWRVMRWERLRGVATRKDRAA